MFLQRTVARIAIRRLTMIMRPRVRILKHKNLVSPGRAHRLRRTRTVAARGSLIRHHRSKRAGNPQMFHAPVGANDRASKGGASGVRRAARPKKELLFARPVASGRDPESAVVIHDDGNPNRTRSAISPLPVGTVGTVGQKKKRLPKRHARPSRTPRRAALSRASRIHLA